MDVKFLQDVLFEMGIVARSKTVRWLNAQLNPEGLPTIKASFFVEWWFYNKLPEQPQGLRSRLIRSRLRLRQKARQRIQQQTSNLQKHLQAGAGL